MAKAAKPAGRKSSIAVPSMSSGRESESVRIRPISNGWLVSRDGYSKSGGYQSTEEFSATKPVITAGIAPAKKGR